MNKLFTLSILSAVILIVTEVPAVFSKPDPAPLPLQTVDFYPSALKNGGFDLDEDLDNKPDGWVIQGKVRRQQDEEGNWQLALVGNEKNPDPSAAQILPIPKNLNTGFTLAARVRGKDLTPASESADGQGGILITYLDAAGKPLAKTLKLPKWQFWQKSFSWRPWSWQMRIPAGAVSLEVKLEIRGAWGKLFFDDVEVLWDFPEDHVRENLIADGGFEYINSFSSWLLPQGSQPRYPGKNGRARLYLNSSPEGSKAKQEIFFKKNEPVSASQIQLDYQIESAGSGGPFLQIDYRDGKGRTLKQFRPPALEGPVLTWQRVDLPVQIPPDARSAVLMLGMEGTNGAAAFDNVRWIAASGSKAVLRPLTSRNDTRGWRPFQSSNKHPEGALDVRDLLDAPAGKFGFTESRDGHFYFASGKRARFFGINLQGPQTLPSHAEAEQLAERLSRLGFNLVRLHHMDAPWTEPNLFQPERGDTRHLSAESLDRLDYFIAQLKKRGMYIYLDLLVSRKFRAGDGVISFRQLERGAKIASLFDPRLIELQKEFAENLLARVNPYTELRLTDDPAIALVDIVNENSLLKLNRRKLEELPVYYQDQLRALWNEFRSGKDFAGMTEDSFLSPELPGVQEFYAGLQRRYFQDMHRFLREIGLKIPVAGSNHGFDGADLAVNAELDYVDRHAYWDHPMGGYGDMVRFNNALLLGDVEPEHLAYEAKRINPIAKLARLKVKDKPFVAGEWNVNWPNEYRAVGALLMAAYACFQDWDAIIQFNYEGRLQPRAIEGNFDISSKPDIFLLLPAAARLFHESHVTAASERISFPLHSEPPYALGLLTGLERTLDPEARKPIVNIPSDKKFESSHGELIWNQSAGVARIQTARTQAVLGRLGGLAQDLPAVKFEVQPAFAVLALTSLDQEEVKASRRLLISAVARAENTGTIYNVSRTLLRNAGKAPILMEPVQGQAVLKRDDNTALRVFALAADGTRNQELETGRAGNDLIIPLGTAFNYEILEDSRT